jgi:hypothetical protein
MGPSTTVFSTYSLSKAASYGQSNFIMRKLLEESPYFKDDSFRIYSFTIGGAAPSTAVTDVVEAAPSIV